MRKYAIREVETVKTTAAFYGCECCPTMPWCQGQNLPPWPAPHCLNAQDS